ncbi:RsmG family class I SAM-dependent methyltransferase [Thermodesulfatator atlanticus]|uniref:RsmG family class I SAM-dependent methyltransferase n=1 Tax=Thermodesulfatator atlanticus TaxID=501497 RepID=UPI0003B6CDBA|nr:RsmG family class I SAM-dependent methyltransferase [Thermodesulfatator atlanticus]
MNPREDLTWDEARTILATRIKELALPFDLDKFWAPLKIYLSAFQAQAASLKLTAAKTRRDLIEGPVLDALFLAGHLPEKAICADLGTGAGFPGFIVKIARPDLTVYLVEAYAPRVAFMRELIQKLGLEKAYALKCHLGFESFSLKVPVAIGRGYGSVAKFVTHAAHLCQAKEAYYLWRKDVEPWPTNDLPLRLVRRLPFPGKPLELLFWQA